MGHAKGSVKAEELEAALRVEFAIGWMRGFH
jgi:hypothetical protein